MAVGVTRHRWRPRTGASFPKVRADAATIRDGLPSRNVSVVDDGCLQIEDPDDADRREIEHVIGVDRDDDHPSSPLTKCGKRLGGTTSRPRIQKRLLHRVEHRETLDFVNGLLGPA